MKGGKRNDQLWKHVGFLLEMNDVIKSWKPWKSRILVNFKSDLSDMLYIEIWFKSALRNHTWRSSHQALPCIDMTGDRGYQWFHPQTLFWDLRVNIPSFFHPVFEKNDNRVKFRTIITYSESGAKWGCIFCDIFTLKWYTTHIRVQRKWHVRLIYNFHLIGKKSIISDL